MKIHDVEQRTPEWHALRSRLFTASECGVFLAEEKQCRLSIADIKGIIGDKALPSKATAAEWQASLREQNPAAWQSSLKWTQKTEDARKRLIDEKLAAPFYHVPMWPKHWEDEGLDYSELVHRSGFRFLQEAREREAARLDRDPYVQRGTFLEPEARAEYERLTNRIVKEVGLISDDEERFGCSPDGIIVDPISGVQLGGLEIKCPAPETHLEWLDAGDLPEEHKAQVHHSMAVTGYSWWDFMSFCPGLPPLIVTVHRDDFTERYLQGLISLHEELESERQKMAEKWNQYANK